MLIYILVTTFSILFIKYVALKPSFPWTTELASLFSSKATCKLALPTMMKSCSNNSLESEGPSLLDLPDLALECILEKLSPATLCTMACICTFLKQRCVGNHLWEKHMKQKWGQIVGEAAYKEWCLFITSRKDNGSCTQLKQNVLQKLRRLLWSGVWYPNSNKQFVDVTQGKSPVAVDSIMSWFLSLETGRFWFPAQVYNRENGHVGFMLSCYDANLRYDPRTDTFEARYPPHGRRAIAVEQNVPWERIRAPPVYTSPADLHVSCSLSGLKPHDHIEIQWRKNKEFPYGWWYGVVGHLESCIGNVSACHCHTSDRIVLEFRQYAMGSRWRSTSISRKDHLEEGDEIRGFYGGVRKLNRQDDISSWNRLWPSNLLE